MKIRKNQNMRIDTIIAARIKGLMKIPTHVISTRGNLLQKLIRASRNFPIHMKRFLHLFISPVFSSTAADVARHVLPPRCREESRRKMAGEEREAAGVSTERVGGRESDGR